MYSYSIGALYILCFTDISGEFVSAAQFCAQVRRTFPPCAACIGNTAQHPTQYVKAALFSLAGYLGVNVVLTLVTRFGALVAVTVTTARKGITIVLSFLAFAKPFTMQ